MNRYGFRLRLLVKGCCFKPNVIYSFERGTLGTGLHLMQPVLGCFCSKVRDTCSNKRYERIMGWLRWSGTFPHRVSVFESHHLHELLHPCSAHMLPNANAQMWPRILHIGATPTTDDISPIFQQLKDNLLLCLYAPPTSLAVV
jgi:hypothetical protein